MECCFLDRVGLGPGVSISQHIWAISSSFQVSHVFPTVVGIEASEPELPGKLTAPYVDRTQRICGVGPRNSGQGASSH